MADVSFTHKVQVRDIPAAGKRLRLSADARTLADLATRLGIVSVQRLEANIEIKPAQGNALHLRGTLDADVVQTCTVTLDPVTQAVRETMDVLILPEEEANAGAKTILLDPEDDQDIEYLSGGRLDLASIVTEHLALGLDPYPRKSGADFPQRTEDDRSDLRSPFDSLKQLKDNNS